MLHVQLWMLRIRWTEEEQKWEYIFFFLNVCTWTLSNILCFDLVHHMFHLSFFVACFCCCCFGCCDKSSLVWCETLRWPQRHSSMCSSPQAVLIWIKQTPQLAMMPSVHLEIQYQLWHSTSSHTCSTNNVCTCKMEREWRGGGRERVSVGVCKCVLVDINGLNVLQTLCAQLSLFHFSTCSSDVTRSL